MNKVIFALVAVLFFGGAYLFYLNNSQDKSNQVEQKSSKSAFAPIEAVVYKSPNCGCCVAYARELEKMGFLVQVVNSNDMLSIKSKYNIPKDKQSCHTIALGSYFIEGHVPMEAIEKLLQEKPEVDGIGLPGMPSGVPGMPGPKRAPFDVYQAKDGQFTSFIVL